MNLDDKNKHEDQNHTEQAKDVERKETNKTDPQITELKGFVDPNEPLEEEGTLNPITGNRDDGE